MIKLNKKGFTIVELVIVIAVIAILAAVLIPTFSGVIQKANESSAQQGAANIYKLYLADKADEDDFEDTLVIKVDEKTFIAYVDGVMDKEVYPTEGKAVKDGLGKTNVGDEYILVTANGETVNPIEKTVTAAEEESEEESEEDPTNPQG